MSHGCPRNSCALAGPREKRGKLLPKSDSLNITNAPERGRRPENLKYSLGKLTQLASVVVDCTTLPDLCHFMFKCLKGKIGLC